MQMNYHLVLETRPGDFMPIDIKLIYADASYNYKAIEEIDSFTKKFTKEEIMIMITDSNTVPFEYLKGDLKVINDNKYRYDVLYKTTDFSLDTFFERYISDKQMMNKFLNVYLKSKDIKKDEMKEAILNKNIEMVLKLLFELSYLDVRNIYTYLANII